MKRLPFALVAFLYCATLVLSAAPASDGQKAALKEILRILPKSQPWEQWLVSTGTMPPNFDALTNRPFLPDPLRFTNGREVTRPDWPRRRAELLTLFQHYVTGSWPASPA